MVYLKTFKIEFKTSAAANLEIFKILKINRLGNVNITNSIELIMINQMIK